MASAKVMRVISIDASLLVSSGNSLDKHSGIR